jgi:hypothetical protein
MTQSVRPGPSGGFTDLAPLADLVSSLIPFEQLLADAGYE